MCAEFFFRDTNIKSPAIHIKIHSKKERAEGGERERGE